MDMLRVNTQLLKDANLSVDDMSLYLRHHGWQEVPGTNARVKVFQGVTDDFGQPLLLIIPSSDRFLDTVLRLSEALELLAALEDCSIEDMLAQIQNFLHVRQAIPLNPASISI
jgi:hypothetical protein